jgi:hypothetical protein
MLHCCNGGLIRVGVLQYTMIPSVGGIYAMFSGNVVIQNVALYASNGVAFGSEHSTAAVTWR